MRAKYGNSVVEIWKIDPQNIDENWVKQAFEDQIIWWNMSDKKVLMVNNAGNALKCKVFKSCANSVVHSQMRGRLCKRVE